MCVYIYCIYTCNIAYIYIYIICILYRNVFQLLCPPLPLGNNSYFFSGFAAVACLGAWPVDLTETEPEDAELDHSGSDRKEANTQRKIWFEQ